MPTNLFGDPVSNKGSVLGCSRCPLDKEQNLRKVINIERVRGKRMFTWAQSPGGKENEKGLELVGPAGQFYWEGLASVGLHRTDTDVQNVLRCRPMLSDENSEHSPTPRELECCSIYNVQALDRNHNKARVHLILGDTAGIQLLGDKFKKDRPIFWHEPWKAYVVLNAHPSYMLRLGGKSAGYEYSVWLNRFHAVRAIFDNPGRWGYIKKQNYVVVDTLEKFSEMEDTLRAEASFKRRVSVDIEDGVINNQQVLLLLGFGTGRYHNPNDWQSWEGKCYTVVVDHPESNWSPSERIEVKRRLKILIEDIKILKTLQNGVYDAKKLVQFLGAKIRGYDYDTLYGTYLRYSFLHAFGLIAQTFSFVPEFGDYWDLVEPWNKNLATAPLQRLALYNLADCDVTKRLEAKMSPEVSAPLVRVYINCAFTLDKMEPNGPILDWQGWKEAHQIVPQMIKELDRRLQLLCDNPSFNCDSPQQVAWLLYDYLKLPMIDGSRSTSKDVLVQLEAMTKSPVPELVQKRRALSHILGTYLEAQAESARRHNGHLATIWWLTGAVTGRLRSGSGDKDEVGIINLQNLHGEPLLQNLLVSDVDWRKAIDGPIEDLLDTYVTLSADESQIEVRMLAELTQDSKLIAIFNAAFRGKPGDPAADVHCLVGNRLTGMPVERIKKEKGLRKGIKNMHFGLIFGKDREGMYDYVVGKIRQIEGKNADLTGITPDMILKAVDRYFEEFDCVGPWIEARRKQFDEEGFVESLFGFRRHNRPNDKSSFWGNQAINTPIQSTAHCFVLFAMALLNIRPKVYNHLQEPVMEIHDALFFRVQLRYLQNAYHQLMGLMSTDVVKFARDAFQKTLSVPLVAEASAGFTGGTMIDYTGEPIEEFLKKWREQYKTVATRHWRELLPSSN